EALADFVAYLKKRLPLSKDADQEQTTLAEVYEGLGLVKMALKDFDGASIDFTEALAIKPTALRYRLRGWAHVFREAPRPARQDFEKAVELDPANGDAYAGRGYTQVKLGDYRKAVRDAEEALRRVPAENEKAVEARRLRYNAARIYAQAAG